MEQSIDPVRVGLIAGPYVNRILNTWVTAVFRCLIKNFNICLYYNCSRILALAEEILFPGVCFEMTQVSLSHTDDRSLDPNWGYNEFWYNDKMIKYGKNDEEYKSVGEHSKKVYDWEILELFFIRHNMTPNFYSNAYEFQKVTVTQYFFSLLNRIYLDGTNYRRFSSS